MTLQMCKNQRIYVCLLQAAPYKFMWCFVTSVTYILHTQVVNIYIVIMDIQIYEIMLGPATNTIEKAKKKKPNDLFKSKISLKVLWVSITTLLQRCFEYCE